jgi:phenylalanyl-tRNA synthetase beta chain
MGAAGRGALDKQRAIGEEEVFLWLKGLVEKLLTAQKVTDVTFQTLESSAFETGRAVAVLSGKEKIGVLGLINSAARKEWRLNDPVAAAELNLEPLISNAWKRSEVKDILLYPATERDFAFIVDETIRHEEILAAVHSAAPAELESVKLFDVFRGKALEKGKKSVAYSFVYRSPSGTLTDEKVNGFHEAVGKKVCSAVAAVIREG